MSKKYRFGIVSKDVLDDPQLSIQAKGLYSLLCTYANKERECFPSRNTLADQLNVSVRYIDTLIKELKTIGYIQRIGRTIKLK
jgi:DNA-binding MarR family transcriptional regulator